MNSCKNIAYYANTKLGQEDETEINRNTYMLHRDIELNMSFNFKDSVHFMSLEMS